MSSDNLENFVEFKECTIQKILLNVTLTILSRFAFAMILHQVFEVTGPARNSLTHDAS